MRKFNRKNNFINIIVVILVSVLALSAVGSLSGGFTNMDVREWDFDLKKRNDENLLTGEFKDYAGDTGISMVANKYGEITINGKYGGTSDLNVVIETVTLPAGTYCLTGASGGSKSTYVMQAVYTEGGTTKYVLSDFSSGKTFTLTAATEVKIQITIKSGTEIDNVKVSPILNTGVEPVKFFK